MLAPRPAPPTPRRLGDALCLFGVLGLLCGCIDGPDDVLADADLIADAAADGPDAVEDATADLEPGPDAEPAVRCAPLDVAETLEPPLIVDRGPCPSGHAVRLPAPAGAAVTARLVALDGPMTAELWWPDDNGWIRADRQPLDDAVDFAWRAPADGAAIRVIGDARWRLAVDVIQEPTRALEVSGRIGGWLRAVTEDGLGEAAPLETTGARIDLLDAENRWLAIGRVAADGRFALSAAAPGGPASLRLVSETAALGIPIRVGPDGELPWAEAVAEVDGSAEVDVQLDPQGATAAAWFVARTAAAALTALGPWLPPERDDAPAVRYRWRPGFSESCGSCFRPGVRPLIDLGGRASDPDEWDRAIITHELGHYVAAVFSRDDSGGGPHDGTPIEPAVAWSEGLATFLASWPETPVQLDYKLAGVARLDLEAMDQPEAFGTADGTETGPISERLVAAVLWDLHDGGDDRAADDDPIALTPERLFAPLFEYLADGWRDVGAPGIDLLDYLDALTCDGAPAELDAVLESRALPHAPRCRQKGHGALTARQLSPARFAFSAASGGVLRVGDREARLAAGETVVWRVPGGATGATLDYPGGRAVLPLTASDAPLRPIIRRAGAWELPPEASRQERVNVERRPPTVRPPSDRPGHTAASAAAAPDRAAD